MQKKPPHPRGLTIERLEARRVFANDFVDPGFGTDGRTELPFPGMGSLEQPESAIQLDGKILITQSLGTMVSEVVRLLPDGELDTEFGDGGRIRVDFSPLEDRIHDVVLDGANRILIAGGKEWRERTSFVARYTSDGELDPTFGDSGVVTFEVGAYSRGHRLEVLEDGSILAVASGTQHPSPDVSGFLVKLDANGHADSTFGEVGQVSLPPMFSVADLAVQPDGQIIVVGMNGDHNLSLLRYQADGRIDSSFGEAGISTSSFSSSWHRPGRVEIGPEGNIFVAGRFDSNGIVVVRFDANGKLDPSYGDQGTFRSPNQSSETTGPEHETDMIVNDEGEVIVLGPMNTPTPTTNPRGWVYWLSPTGQATASVEVGPSLLLSSLAQQSDGRLIAAGVDNAANLKTSFVTRLNFGPLPVVGNSAEDTAEVPSSASADLSATEDPSDALVHLQDDYFAVEVDSRDNSLPVWLNDSFLPYSWADPPKITAVNAETDGGELRIGRQGWPLFYTPPSGFVGTKTFTYTVDDQFTATVTVEVTEKLVGFRLQPVDAAGQPLASVVGGEQFFLNVYVQDLRPNPQGIELAYFDAFFSDHAEPTFHGASFNSEPTSYELGPHVSTDNGILPLLFDNHAASKGAFPGAFTLPSFRVEWNMTNMGGRIDSAVGAEEQLLARIPLTASPVNQDTLINLSTSRADDSLGEIRLRGRENAVPAGAVVNDVVSLEIVNGWQNSAVPADVNSDNYVTPQDVLVLINSINRHGARNLYLEPASQQDDNRMPTALNTGHRDRYLFDVNGDRFLTPLDVVIAINRINSGLVAEGEHGDIGSLLPTSQLSTSVNAEVFRQESQTVGIARSELPVPQLAESVLHIRASTSPADNHANAERDHLFANAEQILPLFDDLQMLFDDSLDSL